MGQSSSRKEMGVDPSDAEAGQGVRLNELKHLPLGGDHGFGKVLQGGENETSMAQGSKREFAGYMRMAEHLRGVQLLVQHRVARPKVIYPD